jgi:hypothetical protein
MFQSEGCLAWVHPQRMGEPCQWSLRAAEIDVEEFIAAEVRARLCAGCTLAGVGAGVACVGDKEVMTLPVRTSIAAYRSMVPARR